MEPNLSRGDRYERTYELRSAAGEDVHGEANFVARFSPGSLLDAGCGTGRVGRELYRRGVDVVGVDLDAEMLDTARARCPSASWIEGDISAIQLGRTFDIVLMAGNVINFVIVEARRQAVKTSYGICGREVSSSMATRFDRTAARRPCLLCGPKRQAWSWSNAGRRGARMRLSTAQSTA